MSTEKNTQVAIQLNQAVGSVLNQTHLQGFEKAYATAKSIEVLKSLLTDEYMLPIMQLQNNKLGFLTDKRTGGYTADVVKNCLIEAVLLGVQPHSNHFNIIASNCYLTKEGLGYILNNFPGLSYELVCGVPKAGIDANSAIVDVNIKWSLNSGEQKEKTIPIPIKKDSYTSVDALIGKATRKGRAWLLGTISGVEVPEGDIQEISYELVKEPLPSHNQVSDDKERERIIEHITKSKTVEDLQKCEKAIKDEDFDLLVMYSDRKRELTPKK